jgi:hypothetical protein
MGFVLPKEAIDAAGVLLFRNADDTSAEER